MLQVINKCLKIRQKCCNIKQSVIYYSYCKGGINMERLNERIKNMRNELHLSQQYVADFIGINRSAVAEIESSKRSVSAEELGKFGVLFGVTTDELLYGTNTPKPNTMFARHFDSLDEDDQVEIMNLIEFKKAMKNRRG